MRRVHVDTNVVCWLAAHDRERLKPARKQLEGAQLLVSPMVRLELQYLHEVQRIDQPADAVLGQLSTRVGLTISATSWNEVVERALPLAWTRDPFDRLIAAHALADGVPLVTADGHIRRHCPWAVWV